RLRAAIVGGDAHQYVVRPGLGVLDLDVEVPPAVEDAGVADFEFRLPATAAAALVPQPLVRELRLRVAIQHSQVGVGRCRVPVEVLLLDVLAVVALLVAEAEQALLEDRVIAVPEGDREAEEALRIREAAESVFAPAVGATARVLEGEVIPGVAVSRVVFANGAPLPAAQVRPPAGPVGGRVGQPVAFGSHASCGW